MIVWEKYESLLLICGYKMGINVFENLDPIGCAKAIIVTGCFARITGIIEEMDIFALLIRTFFTRLKVFRQNAIRCAIFKLISCGVRSVDVKSTKLNTEKGLKTRHFQVSGQPLAGCLDTRIFLFGNISTAKNGGRIGRIEMAKVALTE